MVLFPLSDRGSFRFDVLGIDADDPELAFYNVEELELWAGALNLKRDLAIVHFVFPGVRRESVVKALDASRRIRLAVESVAQLFERSGVLTSTSYKDLHGFSPLGIRDRIFVRVTVLFFVPEFTCLC
jgi:hypothetical protein